MDSTQKQVASLGRGPQRTDPLREEQLRELQAQLESLGSKMRQMEALERTFSQTQPQLEVRGCRQKAQTQGEWLDVISPNVAPLTQKTQQEEELMKKKLQAALQEVCVHLSTPSVRAARFHRHSLGFFFLSDSKTRSWMNLLFPDKPTRKFSLPKIKNWK